MALLTLQELKDLLGVTSTARDTQYAALLLAADAAVKKELDRQVESSTLTDYYSGNGRRFLCLREYPVTAMTSVHLNFSGYYGRNPESTYSSEFLLTEGEDYVLRIDKNGTSESGILERIGTVWQQQTRQYFPGKITQDAVVAQGNIKVIYTAGYTQVPEDLQYAVALLVRRMQQMLVQGGMLKSEKLGDYQYELFPIVKAMVAEPGTFQAILRKYRKTAW